VVHQTDELQPDNVVAKSANPEGAPNAPPSSPIVRRPRKRKPPVKTFENDENVKPSNKRVRLLLDDDDDEDDDESGDSESPGNNKSKRFVVQRLISIVLLSRHSACATLCMHMS